MCVNEGSICESREWRRLRRVQGSVRSTTRRVRSSFDEQSVSESSCTQLLQCETVDPHRFCTMEAFFLHPENVQRLYNCSGRSMAEWKALGVPNVPIGVLYITLGAIYWSTYLPFMVVFLKSDLLQYSCYKIMFFLGIVDITAIPLIGFYGGWAAITGMNYCQWPQVEYLTGAVALGCWAAGSTTAMLLAFNRCVDLMSPRLARTLFSGRRTYLWLLIPTFYFVYFSCFHTAASFNSLLYAYFFDPFLGTPERNGTVDSINFPHIGHANHNFVLVVVMTACYTLLLVFLYQRSRAHSSRQLSRLQRRTSVQAIFVCSGTFVAAAIYLFMQFFPPPLWVVVVGEVTWLSSHGTVGIVYIVFNDTMRHAAARIFCKRHYEISTVGRSLEINSDKPVR